MLCYRCAFIGGVADSNGYGWAIAKALAEAGATIAVGTWPPVLGIFKATLESGKLEEDLKTSAGDKWEIAKVSKERRRGGGGLDGLDWVGLTGRAWMGCQPAPQPPTHRSTPWTPSTTRPMTCPRR